MSDVKGYRHGALTAFELADACERDADKFDDAWRAHMLAEAKRHRSRARWYLHHARAAERMRQWFAEQGVAA